MPMHMMRHGGLPARGVVSVWVSQARHLPDLRTDEAGRGDSDRAVQCERGELTWRIIEAKCVLITGAGRGIGKRLAMGFAAEGARVGLLARSEAGVDLAKLEIEQAGGTAMRLRADVRDPEEMAHAVERMRSAFGGLDVLICAAGVQGPIGPFLSTKPQGVERDHRDQPDRRRQLLPGGAAADDREAVRARSF